MLALAALWWSPGLATWLIAYLRIGRSRHKGDQVRASKFLACSLFIGVLLVIGCGGQVAPSTPAGASRVTVKAVAVQGTQVVTRAVNFNLTVTK